MKPIQLRLQAFGPFATSQTVDFFRVLDGGLFLIHGRTGSGKTSLLDGLCFSLFGRPSTAEREKDLRALRSDIADSSLATETELVFTVGEEAFRVHRIPSQLVPKKRGEGFTELKGSAELWRFHGPLPKEPTSLTSEIAKTENWIPVASKLESVDREIEALLGMNERQFRQVVILPQGKFREFLSSTSAERQTILERLFQTDRFSRLQSFFATHVRDLESKWKAHTQEIEAKIRSTGLESIDEIPNRIGFIQTEKVELSEKAIGLRDQIAKLRDHLQLREDFEATSRRLAEIESLLSALENGRSEIVLQQKKIDLYDLLAEHRTVSHDLQRSETSLSALRKTQIASLAESEAVRARVQTLKLGLEKESATVPSLTDLKVDYQKMRDLFPVLNGISKDQLTLTEERRLINNRLSEAMKRQAADDLLVPEIIFAHTALAHLDQNQSVREDEQIKSSDRLLSEMELSYHQTEAARLSQRLAKNEPCPVCGSTDHPQPARANNDKAMDLQTVKNAQDSHAKLRETYSSAKALRQTKLESLTKLMKSLEIEIPRSSEVSLSTAVFSVLADQTEGQALQLLKSRQELLTLKSTLKMSTEDLDRKDDELRKRIEGLPASDRSLDQVVARGSMLKKQIEARENYVAETSADLSKLEAKLAGLVGSLNATQKEIETLAAEVQRLEIVRDRELKAVLVKHPDFDITNWFCSASERDQLQQSVRSFETKQIQFRAAKEESTRRLTRLSPLIEDSTGASATVASIKLELETLTQELQDFNTRLARLTVELEGLLRLSASIQIEKKNLDKIKIEADRASRINGLLSGDRTHNKLAVPLARFVLQSRFEDVLDQANRRLARMSRGRYLLRRPALSRNLTHSQGLNLSVEDSMSGKERHADSLSGGESFMAALSLALGLADVVQSDLGGVKIDSVIIDEGFGTLDSESLDLALRTLVDLQAGGRMVGVISHVQELKSQIDQRLEVIPSPIGSRLRWESELGPSH